MTRSLALRTLVPFGAVMTVLAAACADSDFVDGPIVNPIGDSGTSTDANTIPDGTSPPPPPRDSGAPDGGDGGLPVSGCGNGVIDPGESCDDGNTISGDGCTAECALENAGPGDMCPGEAIALVPGESGSSFVGGVTGTSEGMFNQYQGTCGGGSGPDRVFRIDPPALGRATVKVTATFPVVLSARGTCDAEATELACVADGGQAPAGTPVEIGFPVLAQQPVFVFVDGVAGTSGDFTLEVDVNTAVCGNGIGEQPEACDDGNTVDGDGCSATCQLEDASSLGTCPGVGYRLVAAPGAPGVVGFSGDTMNPSEPSSKPDALGCPPRAGSNRIYAITPTVAGNLEVDLLAAYPGSHVQIHRICTDAGDVAACIGATEPLTPLSTSVAVNAEETVYVVVDSATASTGGLYTLQATLTADACGDGLLGGAEECDDGNTADGDGCSAACRVERNEASYACPGQLIELNGASAVPYTAHRWGATKPVAGQMLPANKYAAYSISGGPSSNSPAPDVIYVIQSDMDGYVTAVVDANFNASLVARPQCELPPPPDGSSVIPDDRISVTHASTGTDRKTIGFPAAAGVPVYLIVDGYTQAASGSFELSLSMSPRACGNSRVDGGENCDDGNTDPLDGCDANCQLEPFPTWGACETAPELPFAVEDGRTLAKVHSGNANLVNTRSDPTRVHTLRCNSVGPDAWYRIVAPATGSITASIPSATFNSVIGIRKSCLPDVDLVNELACQATATGVLGGQRATAPVVAGETYWVIVDAHNTGPQRGIFDLEIEFAPAGCGDTILTADEQCDDGNKDDGDGCSASCQLEMLAGIDTCPGHEIALTGSGTTQRRAVVTVDTAPLAAQTAGSCGGAARDGVLRVRSDIGGILDVRSTRRSGSFSPVLYAREMCGDPASQYQCSAQAPIALSMPVVANQDYFIFVDALANLSGVAQVDITVTP